MTLSLPTITVAQLQAPEVEAHRQQIGQWMQDTDPACKAGSWQFIACLAMLLQAEQSK